MVAALFMLGDKMSENANSEEAVSTLLSCCMLCLS